MGTGAALILLACGLFLWLQKDVRLGASVSFVVTCALIAFLFPRQVGVNGVDIALRLQCVRDELLTGAMLFSAVFLLNEPYTCAHHRLGRILYGVLVGAITMGPAVGALLGGVFGAVSFYDAITGASAMTGALFQVSPLNTFILCVGMRVLMGLCCGLIFKGLQKLDKSRTWSYILSAMTAPALNTLFFMGYIVLAFYGCDYVQNLVSVKGAANPFMFVVLLVGVQGVAEFLVSGILGGIVARAVAKFLK